MRRGIIAAGCWTLDRIKWVEDWPAEETLSRILHNDKQGGGSAHNVGIDLKKLDPSLPVIGMGLVGEDSEGDFLVEQANALDIDTTGIHRTTASPTSYTDVYTVKPTGKRTFFHFAGANDVLTPDHFDFSDTSAKLLHLGLLGVHKKLDSQWQQEANGWVSILKAAKDAGLQTNVEMVSIDAARNRSLCLPCLPYLDTLIVNDYEIGGLAQIDTMPKGETSPELCAQAAEVVLALGAMHSVVVHYPAGAVCVKRNGDPLFTESVTLLQDNIVSTVGAGDAFAAGILYGIHEDWSMQQATELAHATAAASLRSATTVGSVGTVAECLAYVMEQRK